MKKFTGMILASGLLCSAAFAAEAPQNAAKPAILPANPVKPAAPKQLTVDELLVFLPDTVATVGTKKIGKKDVADAMKAMFPEGQVPPMMSSELVKASIGDFVKILVQERLLRDLATAKGIATEAAVRDFINGEIKKVRPEELEMMKQTLKMQNKTLEGYIDEMVKNPKTREMLAINRFVKENILDKIPEISEKDVAEHYNKNKAMFKSDWVDASHILIGFPQKAVLEKKVTPEMKAKAKADAEAILAELRKDPKKFETLAESKSTCPSGKEARGSLGVFTKGRMIPEFETVAFSLGKDGEISNVVETMYGYHIIRRNGKGDYLPLNDELKTQLRSSMRREKLEEEMKKFFDKLEKENKVQYLVENKLPANTAGK